MSSLRATVAVLRNTTFRSLRHRDYRLYFLGQIVSFTGSWMQSAALMWFVWDRTKDPAWPPRMLVASVGPTLILGTWGGGLADRMPKRELVFRTQAGFLVTAIALMMLVTANLADAWLMMCLLIGIQLVNGVIQSIDLPARLAFVPDLVPREDLINAVSLNSLLFNSARAIGPAMAGLLFLIADWAVYGGQIKIAKWTFYGGGWLPGYHPVNIGAICCFTLNAISFVAVLFALRKIHATGERPSSILPSETTSRWAGVHYVLSRPILALLLFLTGILSIFGWPVLSLFSAYTSLVLGGDEKGYSFLVSGLGSGALIGALTTATFGTIGRRGLFLTLGAGLAATGLAGLTVATTFPTAVVAAAALGFGLVLFLSTGQSALQLNATDEARGRVMALWAMTLSASAPLGHLVTGELAKRIGVVPVLGGMAVGVAAVAVAAGVVSVVRGWRVR